MTKKVVLRHTERKRVHPMKVVGKKAAVPVLLASLFAAGHISNGYFDLPSWVPFTRQTKEVPYALERDSPALKYIKEVQYVMPESGEPYALFVLSGNSKPLSWSEINKQYGGTDTIDEIIWEVSGRTSVPGTNSDQVTIQQRFNEFKEHYQALRGR